MKPPPGPNIVIEDSTSWVRPSVADDLQWKLRYGRLTRNEMLVAASILAAYSDMMTRPEFARKPAMMRRALRASP